MRISTQKRANIRFSEREYQRLQKDAHAYKISIPTIMKKVYFRKNLPQPAMGPDDARRVHIELIRIGNNVNQIAKQLNGGFREGFNPSVDEMRDDIRAIRHFVLGFQGTSKK